MYEHRYREVKLHGKPEFPLYLYKVDHPANVHTILPVHWHNEIEIIFLAKGTALFHVEGRDYSIQSGDALIVHPGELHSATGTSSDGTCYYSFVFKLSWLSSRQTDRIQELFLDPLLQGTIRLPTLLSAQQEAHAELLAYIKELLQRYEQQATGYEMSLKGLLLLLIADIYQQGLTENVSLPAPRQGLEPNEQIKKVLAYMEAHSREKLDLAQLAAVVSLSRTHFCTFFKSQTGMRPMEYLNYIRINQAASLLRSGSYNVLEAALEAGYQHISYFSKWFKFYMHMTPSAYKALHATGL